MKKITFSLIVLGLFFALSGYAQEEFFGNNAGLSASYSRNFNFAGIENYYQMGDGQLSLHLKKGFIFSGEYFQTSNFDFYGGTIGYLTNSKDNKMLFIVFLNLS